MSRIVKSAGILGGEPRLEGRRISVIQIADMLLEGSRPPKYMADQLDISISEVRTAMAYYYDHPDEMDEVRNRHRELEMALRAESSAPDFVQ